MSGATTSGRRRKRNLDGFVPSTSLKRLLVEFGGPKASQAFAAGHSVVLSTHPAAVAARAAVVGVKRDSISETSASNHTASNNVTPAAVVTPSHAVSSTSASLPVPVAPQARDGEQADAGSQSQSNGVASRAVATAAPIIVIRRLNTLDSTERKALQVTATKLKRTADATRDEVAKHEMYLAAGLAFLEHAVAHRDDKVGAVCPSLVD
jgi:hypothetical protein